MTSIVKNKRIFVASDGIDITSSGTGISLLDSPSQVKSLVEGSNITITDNGNSITINALSTQIQVVTNFNTLPDPTTVTNKFYWCSNSQGSSWLPGKLGGTYYDIGLYYSNGISWEYIDVPYQATQSTVNIGTNNDQFVTTLTFTNASKWNTKEDSINIGTTGQYWRGDKTFQTLDKTSVGLSNIDNTSDINKPVSIAQATADTTTLSSANTYSDGKIIDSIADADTTHAPSRNAVFDSLALKANTNDSRFLQRGTTLIFGHASFNPADATNYFIGAVFGVAATTSTQQRFRIESPITGNINRVRVTMNMTIGTTEVATIKINNKTAVTSLTLDSAYIFNNTVKLYTGLTLAVTIGDELEIEIDCPTWVTNPISVFQYFQTFIVAT